MENVIQDLDHQIQIATQQMTYEKDNSTKQKIIAKIKKLKLQKEIAEIRKQIEALDHNRIVSTGS